MTDEQKEWLEIMARSVDGGDPTSFGVAKAKAIRAALRELDAAERVVEEARVFARDPGAIKLRLALAAYDAACKGE